MVWGAYRRASIGPEPPFSYQRLSPPLPIGSALATFERRVRSAVRHYRVVLEHSSYENTIKRLLSLAIGCARWHAELSGGPRERAWSREVSAEVSDSEVAVSGSGRPRTVAEKLNRLFEVLHPAGSRPLKNRELASRVKEHGGSISETYISQLRSGARDNPTLEHLIGIAAAFGVPAGYFTDPEVADRVDAELDRLVEMQQAKPELAEIAEMQVNLNMRTANLDESDKAELEEMVQAFWRRRKQRRAR